MIDVYSMFCARLNDRDVFDYSPGREPIEAREYCEALTVRLTEDFRGQVARPIGIARTPLIITSVSPMGVRGLRVDVGIDGVGQNTWKMERLESCELSRLTSSEEEALRKHFERESEIADFFPRPA